MRSRFALDAYRKSAIITLCSIFWAVHFKKMSEWLNNDQRKLLDNGWLTFIDHPSTRHFTSGYLHWFCYNEKMNLNFPTVLTTVAIKTSCFDKSVHISQSLLPSCITETDHNSTISSSEPIFSNHSTPKERTNFVFAWESNQYLPHKFCSNLHWILPVSFATSTLTITSSSFTFPLLWLFWMIFLNFLSILQLPLPHK